ncbi:MAG: MFS transporter [Candidatus Omnitrophota bacterium]
MFKKLKQRVLKISPDIRLFLGAIALIGFSQAVFNSVFNNFLNDTFGISSLQRSFLELPRELPGFLVVFVSAFLFFMCSRRLAVLALLLQGFGLILIGSFSPQLSFMLAWLFIFSLGQHIFLPLNFSIGMSLAREGAVGKRLGQFSGVTNFAAILGSFTVFLGFSYLHFNFLSAFLIAAGVAFGAAVLLFFMKPDKPQHLKLRLKLHKEYRLFYWLNILYGTRKQIFLTFAPWVLVTIFKAPTQMLAKLLTICGVVGIVFQPILGRAVDRLGERVVLAVEAVVLVFVCLGYGFSKIIFHGNTAFLMAAACFILDGMLISVSMARATYLKKIAVQPEHVTPTLNMGTTIEHFFSISVALLSGIIWFKLGYQYVFVLGALIAVANFFSVLRIRIPFPLRESQYPKIPLP